MIFSELPPLAVLFYFGAPLLVIGYENSGLTIGRLRFVTWFIGLLVAGLFIVAAGKILPLGAFSEILFVLTPVIVNCLLGRAGVRRARQAGINKKYCYLLVVPIVSLGIVLWLAAASPSLKEVEGGNH